MSVNVNGGALEFEAVIKDSDLQHSTERIRQHLERLSAAVQSSGQHMDSFFLRAARSATGFKDVVNDLARSVKKNSTILSASKETLAAYAQSQKALVSGAATKEGLSAQKKILQAVSDQYRSLLQEGLQAYEQLDTQTKRLTIRLKDMQEELQDLSAAHQELRQSFDKGTISALRYQEASAGLATREAEVKRKIAETNAVLQRNENIQQASIGSIVRKQAQLSALKVQYEQLSEAERNNVAVGGKLLAQIRQLDQELKKLNDSVSGTKAGGIGKVLDMLTSIGATLGIGFGAMQLTSFAKDLYDIAREAEGIELAFARLGRTDLLENLRAATKGLVSDLDLQRLTVQAYHLNVPIEQLGKLLAFAQQRSRDTGESVDKLTQNIIDGIGRQSTRIIDNLGISAVAVGREFKKTGDFAQAVANIIDREMPQSTRQIDTLADKTGRLATTWKNLKLSVANFFSRAFSPEMADPEQIAALTSNQLKQYSKFGSLSEEQRKTVISNQKTRIEQLSKAYDQVRASVERYHKQVGDQGELAAARAAKQEALAQLKATSEQLQAASNVLAVLEKQTQVYAKQKRIKQGLYTPDELQQKVLALREEAGRNYDQKVIAQRLSEAKKYEEQYQRLMGGLGGRQSAVKERQRILEQIAQLQAESHRKTLTHHEQELQAVKDKFAKIRREIIAFNRDHQEQKIDLGMLKGLEEKTLEDLRERQSINALKQSIEQKKQLFAQFEEYKVSFGAEKARERYKQDLQGFKTYVDYLQSLMPQEKDLSVSANALRDYLAKEIPEAQKEANNKAFDQQVKHWKAVLEKTKTAHAEVLRINEQYEENLAILRKTYQGKDLADREQALLASKEKELAGVKQLAFEESAFYKEVLKDITFASESELRKRISHLRKLLKESLSPIERQVAQSALVQAEQLAGIYEDAYGQLIDAGSQAAQKARQLAHYASAASASFRDLSRSVVGVNDDLASTLEVLGSVAGIAANVAGAVASFKSGDIAGGIQGALGAIAGVLFMVKKARDSERKASAELQRFQQDIYKGELEINRLYRERTVLQARKNELTLQGLKAEKEALFDARRKNLADQQKVQQDLAQSSYVADKYKRKKDTGIWGAITLGAADLFAGTEVVNIYGSLASKTFEEIDKLYKQGRLEGKTKELFEGLRKLREEENRYKEDLERSTKATTDLYAGTTADAIADSLVAGFAQGKRSAEQFADTFEELMKKAILQSLKYQILEEPIKALREQLAQYAQSDGKLEASEKKALQDKWNEVVSSAGKQFEQLQQITGIDFGQGTHTPKGLSGAVKGITEKQADLLSGQFTGLRMTAVDHLQLARHSLEQFFRIEANTRKTAEHTAILKSIDRKLDQNNVSNQLRANGR